MVLSTASDHDKLLTMMVYLPILSIDVVGDDLLCQVVAAVFCVTGSKSC